MNVQFCLQECLPVQCDNSRHSDSETFKTANSWGRRRRRDTHQHHSQRQTVMSNQTELHREIIVEGMKNKKEALKNIDRTRGNYMEQMRTKCVMSPLQQQTTTTQIMKERSTTLT